MYGDVKFKYLINYLKQCLGYDVNNNKRRDLFNLTVKNAFNYSGIRHTKRLKSGIHRIEDYKVGVDGIWKPRKYDIVDYLTDELAIKSNPSRYIKPFDESLYTSASEYSSYVFCPISLILSKRFNIPSTVFQDTGTILHERTLLAKAMLQKYSDYFDATERDNSSLNDFIDIHNKHFFDDLNNSSLLYSGHINDEPRPFFGEKAKFVGQPDYTFVNQKGQSYVVEEKFRFLEKEESDIRAYKSHVIQLLSYIYMLDNMNLE
jgi:hypothetical protein